MIPNNPKEIRKVYSSSWVMLKYNISTRTAEMLWNFKSIKLIYTLQIFTNIKSNKKLSDDIKISHDSNLFLVPSNMKSMINIWRYQTQTNIFYTFWNIQQFQTSEKLPSTHDNQKRTVAMKTFIFFKFNPLHFTGRVTISHSVTLWNWNTVPKFSSS